MIRQLSTAAAALAVIALVSPQAFANPGMAQAPLSSARAASPPQAQLGTPITGKVLQTMNSGGYSYVLVKKQDGEKVWLAIPQAQVVVGEQMTFGGGMEMRDFQSTSLKKKFDRIIFSEGVVKGAKPVAEAKKSPGSRGAVTKADEKIRVEKAAGANGYTVADVYKLKAKLDKKKIAVRGKVIKVSTGIMDKNWIHIQDGSGSAKGGNNNLVVTSQAVPLVGEIVTATGTLAKDKDFGGGYRYKVILEKADITIQ